MKNNNMRREQTWAEVVRAEFAMRLSNHRNRRAFALFAVLGLGVGIGVYILTKSTGPVPGTPYNPVSDGVQAGGFTLVFLLQFFAISSISQELRDGTLSLSLRLVPHRLRLFSARTVFWPTVASLLYVVTIFIAIPFEIAQRGLGWYVFDMALYQPFTNALFVVMIVFLVHIVRKGPLSLLIMILIVIGMPLGIMAANFVWYGHATLIDTINQLTPMGAFSTLSDISNAARHPASFAGAWVVLLAWLVGLGFFAWRRFTRESSATA